MLNVTPREGQADCHLLELPNGINVLIDAADAWDAPGEAIRQLRALEITELDLVVISHFHRDHYERLVEIARHGIRIGRVAVNPPAAIAAERERPWGCDLEHVHETLGQLSAMNIPWFVPAIGERLIHTTDGDGNPVSLDVVCLYDGETTPVGPTDVNDTSIVLRLSHGETRALFTGDLNHSLGDWLATSDLDLRADVIKVPHHGTESLPADHFFDRVGAKAALVPSPDVLWRSARSMRIRNYFIERGVPTYVSGTRGLVTVTLTARGFAIATER